MITGANTLSLVGDTVTLHQVGDGTTDPTQLTVTAGTSLSLNNNLTIDGAIDLDANVAAIALAANSVIDGSGGTNTAIALADVTGDFDLTLTGDTGASGSAITLDGADVDALALTGGVLTLNGDIESDGALDFTSVDSITLGGNVVITGDDAGTKKDLSLIHI